MRLLPHGHTLAGSPCCLATHRMSGCRTDSILSGCLGLSCKLEYHGWASHELQARM